MNKIHGRPIWYELSGNPDLRQQVEDFYTRLLGWEIVDSGMEGFSYRLARFEDEMVAGMMDMPADTAAMPPLWMIYFAVDNADEAVSAATQAGAVLHRPPADIPGTGRFALLADPQGAAFGVLQPQPMDDDSAGTAFDQQKTGHGNWHELMSPAPQAALEFYGGLLGWQKSTEVPMDEKGVYQLFSHDGQDIGGMHTMVMPSGPMWLPYFGIADVSAAVAKIPELGGIVIHGPQEVPGGAWIAIAQDPQGAMFAIVGPEKTSD